MQRLESTVNINVIRPAQFAGDPVRTGAMWSSLSKICEGQNTDPEYHQSASAYPMAWNGCRKRIDQAP